MAHTRLWLAGAMLACGIASAQPPLEIQFEAQSLVVEGVSAGEEIHLHAVSREWIDNSYTRVNTFNAELVDDDRDASVSYDLGRKLPWRSIWIAIEAGSGRAIVGSPHEAIRPFRDGRAVVGPDGILESSAAWLDVLLVRPGVGQWQSRVFDGDVGDDDGAANGENRVRLEVLESRSPGGGPPGRMQTEDKLILLDLQTLEVGSFFPLEVVP